MQRRTERSALFSDAASAASSASASTTSSATGNQKVATNVTAAANTLNNNHKAPDASKLRTFHVTLYKDTVYDDYGFSLSDGLYERGVFINRIRSGGPADVVGLLKPFDRIMQVIPLSNSETCCRIRLCSVR